VLVPSDMTAIVDGVGVRGGILAAFFGLSGVDGAAVRSDDGSAAFEIFRFRDTFVLGGGIASFKSPFVFF